MLSDQLMDHTAFDAKSLDLADVVVNNRPFPIRNYDQIYMYTSDMLRQTRLLLDYAEGKHVVFLGDGDGISSLLNLLGQEEKTFIAGTAVFDFDQRILNSYQRLIDRYDIPNSELVLYNVLEPVPVPYRGKYDLFYINPPYGSKNSGLSCIAWLHRCLDLCASCSSGFLVVPYDKNQSWTVSAMNSIQKFLLEHGFVIRDMVSEFHKYHLEENPELRSAVVIVDRIDSYASEYQDRLLPRVYARNLYGSPRRLPRYILDDQTKFGHADYLWEYGEEFFGK